MFSIRIAATLCYLLIPAFAGTATAQNVTQSDLCALEARSTSAELNALAQIGAEENPLKRSELGQAATKTAKEAYRARLDFFGAKGDPLNTSEILGARPFTGLTGKITRFIYSDPGTLSLSVVLDCPEFQPRAVVLATQFANTASTQWFSSVSTLRDVLLQIKVGSVVELSGTIFAMASPPSPMVGKGATVYWTRVIALKTGLSGVTQGTEIRSQ